MENKNRALNRNERILSSAHSRLERIKALNSKDGEAEFEEDHEGKGGKQMCYDEKQSISSIKERYQNVNEDNNQKNIDEVHDLSMDTGAGTNMQEVGNRSAESRVELKTLLYRIVFLVFAIFLWESLYYLNGGPFIRNTYGWILVWGILFSVEFTLHRPQLSVVKTLWGTLLFTVISGLAANSVILEYQQ